MDREVDRVSSRVASNNSFSDYDIWRALKSVNDELYRADRLQLPIPIDSLYKRKILSAARDKRLMAG